MQPSPMISSPSTSPSPIEPLSYKVGQEVAFIYNRTDLIPGVITSLNPDSTFDLECQIPLRVRKVTFLKGLPDISYQTILQSSPFLKATPADPRMQLIKIVTSLQDLGMEPIEDSAFKHKQSSISAWRDSGKRSRIPRLTEFLAPLVGHFFDSSLFYYRIYCWRAPIRVRGQGDIPEEIRYFPNPTKKPFFTSFSKCFSRYMKEYLENLEKWNRVEIQAILPEDVKQEIKEGV